MSKQLSISSAFAVFAMAAMTLSMTADYGTHAGGEAFVPALVEVPSFEWPSLPFTALHAQ
ncbi:hypothetical protein [Altererythrobacter sp. GH1-8]|uniref:hypothetical protein n=1 Tax=Altererythrobacter sp. GH1-8 TaxID=3349333 RepID=UPI00374DA194